MRAVQAATPAVWGVILQFPFYAGIAGIITATHLNERLAGGFVSVVDARRPFPPLVAIYSAVLGVFVPSGGSKWVIDAPYVMAGGAHAEGAPRVGGVGLRPRRGAREPGAAVLDAADPRAVPARRPRRDGLHDRRASSCSRRSCSCSSRCSG